MAEGSRQTGSQRRPDPLYRHIGARLRLARKAANMTQEKLAAGLGVAFQQVQKYEKGISTIGAARLHHAATILNVPVTFFFPEPQRSASTLSKPGDTPPEAAEELLNFLGTSEGVELSKSFSQIGDADLRHRVVDLVRSIARSSDEGPKR